MGRVLSEAGGRVALLARDTPRLRLAVERLGVGAVAVAADVSDAGQVKAAVESAVNQLGGLDVVVTAAGFGVHFSTETPYEEAVAAWDREIGVNLRGLS